jgi:phosphate transport system substrate-binding protein
VALDGLSIYVNDQNPITQLSLPQLKQIFTGKIRNWKELGGPDLPITIYSRENSSGTYEFFKEHVLEGHDFAASAQAMPGTAALMQAVAKDPKGIGYGGAAYGSGARALLVSELPGGKGIEPSAANIITHRYPIWRFLYIYVSPALDKNEVHQYLDWIRGPEGQALVQEVGYFPLPENFRAGSVANVKK